MKLSCFVEVPRGSRNKYEYDESRGVLKLDRHIFASVVFPADYGFLEQTVTDTGDHLDALVLVTEPTFPGCRIDVRPIGLFRMRDEEGVDDKVLCVPLEDPEWRDVDELDDVSARLREEIEHFFSVYKDLEAERATVIVGWADREAAEREVEAARARFADAAVRAPSATIPREPGPSA
jgi:inorganic pyrophosphatase